MNLKEKLKTELMPLYDELIKEAYRDDDYHSIFCMQWGKKFPQEKNEGILFVGRATNGWSDPSEHWGENQVTAEKIFNDDENYLFACDDQMKWVEDKWNNREGYNTKKSSFWRVIKDITKAFYPQEDWYNYVAWSNVCKIAPSGGGNPDDESYYNQLPACQKILQKEIEVLSPKYVVFLTGWDWAKDFVSYLNGNKEPEKSESIQWSDDYSADMYRIKDTTCIVSKHPERKPEENHISAIIEIISGKFKPVIDVLKKHFGEKLKIGYKPKHIQLYFEIYQYWLELWYYPDKIYLYLCSKTDCEGTTKGGLQFKHQEDENGFCYYASDEASCYEHSETDKMLNEAVIPILKDLSQG
ncbi:MAG: hypothetical protein MdMp024_0433 [Bacteroidales bacterium]